MGYLSFYFKYEFHAVEIIFFSCCYETLIKLAIYINTFLTTLDVCAEQGMKNLCSFCIYTILSIQNFEQPFWAGP